MSGLTAVGLVVLVVLLLVHAPGAVLAVLGSVGAVAVWAAAQPLVIGVGIGLVVPRLVSLRWWRR
ncbi:MULTISPECIES: hypothetical protein [Streptomyces]|uniref:Uncharacterized protein n=2 Tax=Streptomyces TaxID=1883 RepID=A0A6G4AYD5_9ACTN|nr:MULTISPECIES: hypothetical protein [Streptomyces]MCQ8195432.1 hypothetical protein [Streptomyces rugosispiralis]NEW77659.1 hypothetical protein [Streptomyces rhizosphaericus]